MTKVLIFKLILDADLLTRILAMLFNLIKKTKLTGIMPLACVVY